jgi:DNA helicase-2/ATP-dependent DNA helicase PcrA
MIPWDELNPEQAEAVRAAMDPLLVMAPVGTGKTRVLALRAAYAIGQGVPPGSMLCLSFTNKAAREMKQRLAALLGKLAAEVTAKTFHSLCAAIARAEAKTLGLDADFVIYDEEDCASLLGLIWPRFGIEVPRAGIGKFNFMLFECMSRCRLTRYDDERPLSHAEIFQREFSARDFKELDRRQNFRFGDLFDAYRRELRENHALDFAGLIASVNWLWDHHPEAVERWRRKFTWIQVDEVQDTNRGEYRILERLARPPARLSFFGDVDQTIYEWRGSAPRAILGMFRASFHPVREIKLVTNYRSTRPILEACSRLVKNCPGAVTREIAAHVAEAGDPVRVRQCPDPAGEADWIASTVETLRARHGLPYSGFAVLTRNNFSARDFSREFERLGLPHLKVDEMKFYQRAEVKAALAHLRLLETPHDGASLMRVLKTPPKGIGEAALEFLRGEPRRCGLKLSDLLAPRTYELGEPFAPLLGALDRGEVVVFDFETTGLDPEADEIVQIAAARCGARGITADFNVFVRPSHPVGESERIHGFSDAFLAGNGREPAAAIEEFARFCGGAVLAGHNVLRFDVPLLASFCQRHGVRHPWPGLVYDTHDLAKRFHALPQYTLAALAKSLGLERLPTHKAGDDVAATVELLLKLSGPLRDGARVRLDAVGKAAARFKPLAARLERWRERMLVERPAELLLRILDESGLAAHYEEDAEARARIENLKTLAGIFEGLDDPALSPRSAFIDVLNAAALGTDVDRQCAEQDKVLLLTAHQAKGLEFDTVFIANATDREFPSARSAREGRLDEEHRIFYVAASRARKRLFATYPRVDRWRRRTLPSRYLIHLAPRPARED